jgi:glucan 1,3-beta-glucosidase
VLAFAARRTADMSRRQIAPSQAGSVQIPLWSYKLGLDGGWIPRDPRTAAGSCASFNATLDPFDGAFAPSQTGGGAGVVDATARASFAWPPPLISGVPDGFAYEQLPAYAPGTATLTPLAMPTFADAKGKPLSVSADGWKDGGDRPAKVGPVPDCVYPPVWSVGPTLTAVCSGAGSATLGSVAGAATPPPTSTAVRR